MSSIRYRISQFVFLSVFIFCSSALAQGGSTLFNCLTSDSVLPPGAPAGERTLSPVAIYACSGVEISFDKPGFALNLIPKGTGAMG